MLYRLPDLRNNMFDMYVDTFEALPSTVLVRRWRLTDDNARQQRRHGCVTIQSTAHNGSYTSLVIIEPKAGMFRAALMRLHHVVWTSRQSRIASSTDLSMDTQQASAVSIPEGSL
jgi:hypothetical protein